MSSTVLTRWNNSIMQNSAQHRWTDAFAIKEHKDNWCFTPRDNSQCNQSRKIKLSKTNKWKWDACSIHAATQ